jgi:hypothetical protein
MTAGDDRIRAPIVVLGAPRSGTTLLAQILGEHPQCVRAREARLVWRYGNDRRSDELGAADATPDVIAHIHRHFLGLLPSPVGDVRLVEKTPANAVRPWFVHQVFPDARFVHITRDGWSCVPALQEFWDRRATGFDSKQRAKAGRRLREASVRQVPAYAAELVRRVVPGRRHLPVYGPRIAGLQQAVDELGSLHAAALQWNACVTSSAIFGRELGRDHYCEVKLETLDTAALEGVLEFCHLPPAPDVLKRFDDTFDAGTASRRRPLSEDDRRQVAPLVLPANALLGYGT